MEDYQFKSFLLTAITAFLCLTFALGWKDIITVLGNISTAITIAVLANLIYRKTLWKIDPVLNAPKLYKEKEAIIAFSHAIFLNGDSPASESGIKYKRVRISISQTVLNISMVLQSGQIESNVIVGKFIKGDTPGEKYDLYYVYKTEPNNLYRSINPSQIGACHAIYDFSLGCWAGDYWINQLTRGRIYFASYDALKDKLRITDDNLITD